MSNKEINDELQKQFKIIEEAIRKQHKDIESQLIFKYKELLKDIRFSLSEMYRKYGDKVTFDEMKKYRRLEYLEKKIAEDITNLTGESISLFSKQVPLLYKSSSQLTTNAIGGVLEIDFSFSLPNFQTIRESLTNPYDRVGWEWRTKGHHLKSIEKVKSEITRGLIEGKGFSKTTAEITQKVNGLTNNVVRIVRTESHRVQVAARNDALEKSIKNGKKIGITLVKVISSVLDDRTRAQSSQMHGQMAGKDGLFRYPNGVRGLPGNTGVAEFDINDRETIIVQEKSEYLAMLKKR